MVTYVPLETKSHLNSSRITGKSQLNPLLRIGETALRKTKQVAETRTSPKNETTPVDNETVETELIYCSTLIR